MMTDAEEAGNLSKVTGDDSLGPSSSYQELAGHRAKRGRGRSPSRCIKLGDAAWSTAFPGCGRC